MMFVARVIHYAFSIYTLGLLAYVVCSWIVHPAAQALRLRLSRWYEPLLAPIRRVIPPPRFACTAVDLSPIILFIGLSLVKGLLLSLLVPAF
jgi:YggT family protein